MQKQKGEKYTASIYAGSSSSIRSFDISIKKQVNNCWNFSCERGWKVKHVFIDVGEYRSLMDRTNFQKMIKEARTGKFDFVVLCKLEDLCGSPSDLPDVTELLRQSSIPFRNVDDQDGGSIGEFK
jgi:DNA invertase Pin-like site-specific DNA recombinase